MTKIEKTPADIAWLPQSEKTRGKILACIGDVVRFGVNTVGDVGAIGADIAGSSVRNVAKIASAGVRGLIGAKPYHHTDKKSGKNKS